METGGNKETAKAGGANPGEEDLSMEEILHSIRKIIAEDDKETQGKAKPKANGGDDVPGSDVLELTEMIKEDGSTVNVKAEPAKPAAPAAPPADVLNKIDEALAPEKPAEKAPEPLPAPAPKVEAAPPPPPPPPPPTPAPTLQPSPAFAAADSLLSPDAAAAGADAFKRLKNADMDVPPPLTTPAPSFRSGVTVEDMVAEMLRPMMKSWLDANLPAIVERIVEREVKKLTR